MLNPKFWIENIYDLFKNFNLFPNNNMQIEEKYNCISRFLFVLFFILVMFNFKYSPEFLFLSILILIVLYYKVHFED